MESADKPGWQLDPGGFNELRMCRTGPMLYNKFDEYVGGSLMKYGEYSFAEQRLLSQVVRPGFVVVEAGANIGAHTSHLARCVGPDGEVHAFEPQRIVFQTLCANVALNQCTNVYAYQAALGAETGSVLVPAMNPEIRANFGGVSLQGVIAGERVQQFTLDSLDLPACHVIKVDVEGMEVEVLKGAVGTIESYRPIMYLENDRGGRSEELLTILLQSDYAVYWHIPRLYNPANFAGVAENIFPDVASVNVLCLPLEAKRQVHGMPRVTTPTDTWRTVDGRFAERVQILG